MNTDPDYDQLLKAILKLLGEKNSLIVSLQLLENGNET